MCITRKKSYHYQHNHCHIDQIDNRPLVDFDTSEFCEFESNHIKFVYMEKKDYGSIFCLHHHHLHHLSSNKHVDYRFPFFSYSLLFHTHIDPTLQKHDEQQQQKNFNAKKKLSPRITHSKKNVYHFMTTV
ncbi:hypothetical protein DERF_011295 [Dermatophagoides farinae]|uniref:Uncharacterized protein n=1 Tax=Dermatophagoides farinae TaxID=6954 RepID=A0A922HUA1_DERFA|nr:hypothetical protein DERF_011295 [Dermatophagoides farinae]